MTTQCGQGCKEGNTENGILFKGLLEAPAEGSDFSLIVGRQFMALTESDIFWNATDTGWVKAAWTLFCAWLNGSCVFVHELPQVEAKVILNTLSRFPITTYCSVPTIYRMLVQEDLTRRPSRMNFWPQEFAPRWNQIDLKQSETSTPELGCLSTIPPQAVPVATSTSVRLEKVLILFQTQIGLICLKSLSVHGQPACKEDGALGTDSKA